MGKSKRRPKPGYTNLRKLMQTYRTTLGLTYIDCVRDLEGINAERWKNIERGRVIPTLHDGVVLATRLGVNVSQLLDDVR